MPKFPNIPRLTIVVPFSGKTEVFESSLVSVLQHRPDDCEILVPHAGDYDDPFDLGDEVTFVNAGSSNLIHQVAESAERARGRIVHIVGDGHLATPNWSASALAEFELHETGWVIPVVRDAGGAKILHAGWKPSSTSACGMVAKGKTDITAKDVRSVDGAFLCASFWRRDLLRSLSGSFTGSDAIETSLIYSQLARRAGWRGVVAVNCCMVGSDLKTVHAECDYAARIRDNHQRLQAIADHFHGGGWGKSFARLLSTIPTSGLRCAMQRATAPLAAKLVSKQIRTKEVLRSDEPSETLRIHSNATDSIVARVSQRAA